MASGVNYNGVWASTGKPQNVIPIHKKYEKAYDFLICGSESAGIVYATGKDVKDIHVGDEVVCIGNQYDENCPIFKATNDPRKSPSFRIWGYEGNWGGFAQFSKVQHNQCCMKPKQVPWEVAGSCIATGGTVHNMLTYWKGNTVQPYDPVLIWGGAGGLGSNTIKLVKAMGGIPIAVVSSDERGEYCKKIGARGYINRSNYDHWGMETADLMDDVNLYRKWLKSVVRFRKEFYKVLGEKRNPRIVIEHPGQDTLPTSMFICDTQGMVTLCGATTGFCGTLDLRYLWLYQKRLQGSHAGILSDAIAFLDFVSKDSVKVDPPNKYSFDDVGILHQKMYENQSKFGNSVIMIGAKNG